MAGKKMEGNEEQKRKKAREAREEGKQPSEEGVTSGASKQRHRVTSDDHREKVDSIRRGKQSHIRETTPSTRPGYGPDDDEK